MGESNISEELLKTDNVFFLEEIAVKGIANWGQKERANIYTKEQIQSESFVKELNSYLENNEEVDTTSWKKWKYIKNQYLCFE